VSFSYELVSLIDFHNKTHTIITKPQSSNIALPVVGELGGTVIIVFILPSESAETVEISEASCEVVKRIKTEVPAAYPLH